MSHGLPFLLPASEDNSLLWAWRVGSTFQQICCKSGATVASEVHNCLRTVEFAEEIAELVWGKGLLTDIIKTPHEEIDFRQ